MSHTNVRALSSSETTRLIKEVHARPLIWNPHIVSGKETTDRLWSEIADALALREKDIKAKWKNLKDQFRKEMKKKVEGGTSYTPQWPHYQRLSFLTDIMLQSKRISYSSDELQYVTIQPQADIKLESEDSCADYHCIVGEASSSPKRRRETETDDGKSSEYISDGRRCSEPQMRPEFNTWDCYSLDEDYHFFMSLIPHMKNFSSLQKLRVRNKIQQVLIEEMSDGRREEGGTSSSAEAVRN